MMLHNAFRHGESWVVADARMENSDLRITVSNDAEAGAVEQLRSLDMHGNSARRASFVRMRVGLRSAALLAQSVGGWLEQHPVTASSEDGVFKVAFTLRWPSAQML